jgi:hypothetical protein
MGAGYSARRAFAQGVVSDAELRRAFDKNRVKVAAGGCGRCGLTADPNLRAMGNESFFVCSLLILRDLQNRRKVKFAVKSATLPHDVLSIAREASAAPAATF